MNPSTLSALEESIDHWIRMASETQNACEEPYARDCPLCEKFRSESVDKELIHRTSCSGCPVFDRTGLTGCRKTPYDKAEQAYTHYGIESEEFKAAAREEIEFLRSLLPENTTKP